MTLTIYSIPRRWGDAPVWTGEVDFGGDDDAATRLGKAVVAARLDGANLDRARLDGARLDGARLIGASLDGASLDGASLIGASLDGASLIGARLDRASLDRARLDGARLIGASLIGARLDGASLIGARLDGARPARASLDGASLDGASLDGARLIGANLGGASLDGASLDGARWGAGATYGHRTPITRTPIIITGLHWSVLIFDGHMKIGCELHSLADWDQFDDRRILQMDGRAALGFWRANKVSLLAMARATGRVWSAPESDEAA